MPKLYTAVTPEYCNLPNLESLPPKPNIEVVGCTVHYPEHYWNVYRFPHQHPFYELSFEARSDLVLFKELGD